ncbi:MAG: hypothetical protein KDD99_29085, partial [Bacteroidetes bacterium]|nr:hypothetical protein [Bacteroidota bacterium]
KYHHLDKNPFGKKSPFFKFLNLENSWVLTLGISGDVLTCFRTFESLAENYPLKIFADEEFEIDYYDENGNQGKMTTYVHNPEFGGIRRNDLYAETLRLQGDAEWVKVGYSESLLVKGPPIWPTMQKLYDQGYYPFTGYFPESIIQE